MLFFVGFGGGSKVNAAFHDVPYTHWAFEDVRFVSKHGVIRGFSDGSFQPNQSITRKDAVVMMTRALDAPKANGVMELEDVKPTTPNYKELLVAITNDWLTVEDDRFYPNAPLTRDEMSKMLATIYEYKGRGVSSFSDVPKSDTYYAYIDAIAFHNVTTGYKDETFRPKEKVTRAQFSAFLSRIYQSPVAYEVKNAGETVAVVPSVEDALEVVEIYPEGTIHPQSNKFVEYEQTIATSDKTGINNGVLIYNGFNENNSFTPAFFDSYLKATYDDKPVNLFETFIILGLRYNEENAQFADVASNKANYEDWKNYVDRTFSAEGALHNLNASAIQHGRQVDVYLTIPYPKRSEEIVTLDGRELYNDWYSRYDLVRWYVEQSTSQFDRAKYSNLNLKGFYWLSETVRTLEDERLTSSVSSLLAKQDLYFIYSPHATSTNFYKWRDYGFDAAFLQPNAFRTAIANKEERLHRAFLNAQIYGTGITMEIDSYGPAQAEQGLGVEAFDLYTDFAKRYGLDEKGMIFYQDRQMVWRMANIDQPTYKRWYDQLISTFFVKE